jgi:hypothetical protein
LNSLQPETLSLVILKDKKTLKNVINIAKIMRKDLATIRSTFAFEVAFKCPSNGALGHFQKYSVQSTV